MKILVLSFYFRPDLCAGSFRTTALTEALVRSMPPGGSVDVVTTLPNRYSSFSVNAPALEEMPGMSIQRVALPSHKSGMVDQAKAFLVFAREVLKHVQEREYDLIVATSSRLMTAALGAWIARRKRVPLYLDIRDIFVDTIKDVLPKPAALLAKSMFTLVERWTIRSARKVNLVSGGFTQYFTDRYPGIQLSHFTNGIDDEFLSCALSDTTTREPQGIMEILYAGNLGEGQGLHAIIPELARRMRGRARFKIIGDGGRKDSLRSAVELAGLDNVEILPPVGRKELIAAYQAADVLFLHLNDHDAFKKVLPSKLFEYAAMGKPILLGVAGFTADFVLAELDNVAVFPPCDAAAAVRAINQLQLGTIHRDQFIARYARKTIVENMARDILDLAHE